MRHILLIVITLLFLVGCSQEVQQPIQESTELPLEVEFSNPNPKTHHILIDYTMKPSTLNINKGDSVVWLNTHDSYSNLIFSEFDIIIPGKTIIEKTFLSVGKYNLSAKETGNSGIVRVN